MKRVINKKLIGLSSADKATDGLLKALGKWVDSNGGKAIVAGGIGITQTSEFKFNVIIGVTGTPPVKKEIKP